MNQSITPPISKSFGFAVRRIGFFALMFIVSTAFAGGQTSAPNDSTFSAIEDNDALYAEDKAARNQRIDEKAFNRQFKRRTATVNGISINYFTGGRGEPLVLLHGFTQTSRAYRRVMPALAEKYTLIVPDLRGFGDSERKPPYEGRTVADDVFKLVQSLGHKQILLVGHDLGGPAAYSYAAQHPQDVRKLVILEGTPPGFEPPPTGENEADKPLIWHPMFQMTPNLPEALTKGREKVYLEYFFRNFAFDPQTFSDEEIGEYARAYAKEDGMHAAFEHYRAIPETARQNKEYGRSKLPMPVLAMGGAKSYGKSMEASARIFASDVRGLVIERAGHFIPDERPVYFTRILLSFFGERQTANVLQEKR
jgi:pimeloyl-ACP methyl ester carboxylesterase